MSLEMAQKVIVPQKKNYVPQFLKQRDINSYFVCHYAKNGYWTSLFEKGLFVKFPLVLLLIGISHLQKGSYHIRTYLTVAAFRKGLKGCKTYRIYFSHRASSYPYSARQCSESGSGYDLLLRCGSVSDFSL
jgi:hypothetical protein